VTGWTRREECDRPCPITIRCSTLGMNANTLDTWIDKPLDHEMTICGYPSDAEVNFQPRTAGQRWVSTTVAPGGGSCSFGPLVDRSSLGGTMERRTVTRVE
jgi:hypothetical protein